MLACMHQVINCLVKISRNELTKETDRHKDIVHDGDDSNKKKRASSTIPAKKAF